MASRLNPDISLTVPLETQMWGDNFGMCIDEFGVGWMAKITQAQS